jgi:2-keto-4-pentenoate hydratase/2-oxohepta-3-ene-1,7-dioic acid hydratase in catechol pathway
MKLVSYAVDWDTNEFDREWRAGIAVQDGIVDASGLATRALGRDDAARFATVRSILGLGAEVRDQLAEAVTGSVPEHALASVSLGPPVPNPDKIICLGLNYREHAREAGLEIPPVPVLFPKFRNALIGAGAPIDTAIGGGEVDYEAELAVVIGQRCRNVERPAALSVVAGYMPFNDVSARDLQMQTSQWMAGKIADSFAPCGPWLTTADEVDDPQSLELTTRLNGQVMQRASTSDMIFGVVEAIAFVSSILTLEPGDIIATGTPSGVGFSRTPPVFLTAGDEVEIEISGLGLLRNPVTGS